MNIQRAAVLGAGVMGAQIAAHLTNAGIQTILFDLASDKGDINAIVESSLKSLSKLKPLPLGTQGIENSIIAANYNTDLEKLRDCNLVIEAISEKLEWKQSLYEKVIPFLSKNVIFGTNTSGLSINALARSIPEKIRSNFCGIHFFNPPRYMKLVEIIPHASTDPGMLNYLEAFLTTRLGKGVIHAQDTPNFIGNRIGVFAFLSAMHHAAELKLSPDIVDALTGPLIKRPKSATFRTLDIVGLDTMAHVVNTMKKDLSDDPWASFFKLPAWIEDLISKGALGQKKNAGIYKKVGQDIQVYDVYEKAYRPIIKSIDKMIDPKASLEILRHEKSPQAQFLWRIHRDLFHYCAYHAQYIAHSVRDIDLAVRWGYGWERGPFEIWQLSNWQKIFDALSSEIAQNMTLVPAALPDWVHTLKEGPYQDGKAYSPKEKSFVIRSELPIYRRQYFPDHVLTEGSSEGDTIFETPAVRMWTLDDNIPILSFKSKKNTISLEVLEGIQEAIKRAEKDYTALVLWQRHENNFSLGADLKQVGENLKQSHVNNVENFIHAFQQTALALRYSRVPTVAAIRGLTLGGGCELSMHATKIVAAFETYIGLVEVGVGLIPAGAGTKELAYRASQKAIDGDIFTPLKVFFNQIATAQLSLSAMDAKRLNYLAPSDTIVYNTDELLFVAKKQAAILADIAYFPPLSPRFPVAGKSAIANFQNYLINLREGEFISDYDYLIGSKVAHVLCGGNVEAGSIVTEEWMLGLEREAIMALLQNKQTIDRIKYTLEKGKPLRN